MAAQVVSPFRKTEVARNCLMFYAKKDATWEQIDAYLEHLYGKDKHMSWKAFGDVGTEEFCVVVFRRVCYEGEDCKQCNGEDDDGFNSCDDLDSEEEDDD